MNRLKILRLNKGITQEQLANFINDRLSENEKPISKMVISNWENNKHTIKPDKTQQLADFFEVNVGYLLGYEDNYPTRNLILLDALLDVLNQSERDYLLQKLNHKK